MEPIDLQLAERVMQAIADTGLARRKAMELHSDLRGDLGLKTLSQLGDVAIAVAMRFGVLIMWAEVREWLTIADAVRSVQRGLAK